ncbi:hypothetical protein MBT84_48190 [Streptomyces sp. MBT84]|nr:hypothetical protein [Streptomyces sp. MBT84]
MLRPGGAAAASAAGTDRRAARRRVTGPACGPGAGSSPLRTGSKRSTAAWSAKRRTATSASSSAVRVTSRVPPTRLLASLSSVSRSRATIRPFRCPSAAIRVRQTARLTSSEATSAVMTVIRLAWDMDGSRMP